MPSVTFPLGVVVIVGLAALTFAIIEGPRAGWTSPETLGVFALAATSLVALVPYELHRRDPLIEVRFFRSAPLSGASAIAILTFAGIGGFLFLNTLYLQTVRGLSPLHAGLYLLPMAAMIAIFAPISGRIVGSRGARLPIAVAAVAIIAGAAMLTQLSDTTPFSYLLVSYVLFGIGNGLINPPITNTAVTGMPAAQAGVASAVASTSRQVGMTLGVAVIGAISAGTITGAIGTGFAPATHAGWWIIVGLGVAILAIGLVTTGAWAKRTARRAAEEFPDRPAAGAYRARTPAAARS